MKGVKLTISKEKLEQTSWLDQGHHLYVYELEVKGPFEVEFKFDFT